MTCSVKQVVHGYACRKMFPGLKLSKLFMKGETSLQFVLKSNGLIEV